MAMQVRGGSSPMPTYHYKQPLSALSYPSLVTARSVAPKTRGFLSDNHIFQRHGQQSIAWPGSLSHV